MFGKTLPLTVTVPENHEDMAIIDVIDSYASVHATYVERNSIHSLPNTWRNACGFYILFSPIKDDSTYSVYVGKSDKDFTKRMRSHDENKEDWVVALLVQRKSVEGLSSTQSSYLEGALRDIFVKTSHVRCHNIARTGDWTLPEHDKALMAQVVDSTLRIMLLRGYRIVDQLHSNATSRQPLAAPPKTPQLTTAVPHVDKSQGHYTRVLDIQHIPAPQEVMTGNTSTSSLNPTIEPTITEPKVRKPSMFSFLTTKKTGPVSPDPEKVFTALLEWRKEQSKILHTKYRYILEDYTLRALAEKMPATYDDLLKIPGIKEKKREQFGKSLLKVLDQFR